MAVYVRKAVVLGGGRTGAEMALDLLRSEAMEVTVADHSEAALDALSERANGAVATRVLDLSEPGAVAPLVSGFHVVLSALPGEVSAAVLEAVIESNRLIADAGTPIEAAEALDARAKEMEVAACVGCGRDALRRLSPRLASPPPDEQATRIAALLATSLARRLLTGDFRGHWGVWTPERLAARPGMAHGLVSDLRARGVLD